MKIPLLTVDIQVETDVVLVRQRSRQISALLGFDNHDQTRIATAVSEVARNAFQYAKGGKARFILDQEGAGCLVICITDSGPGIADFPALIEGSGSVNGKTALGLRGCRKLMDQFRIDTSANSGTEVYMGKELPTSAPELTADTVNSLSEELARIAPPSPLDAMRQQNQELLQTLDELKERQQALEASTAAESVARAEAEAAVQARDELLAIVSHDLRNPLNTISSTALVLEQLIESGKLPKQVGKFSRMISRSSERMERLIGDLFDIASIEAGQLAVECSEHEAHLLVAESIDHLSSLAAERKHELVSDADTGLKVYCDKDRVLQILSNLIGNAVKFTPEGGTITVRGQRSGKDALFCVEDTGCGIPPEELPYTFDRFWQAMHKRKKGMGLGLSIVKGLVEAHRGRVWVESEPDEGCRFYFTLPLSENPQRVS